MVNATTTSGTVIKKTDPHQKYSSGHPPITGPMDATPPQILDQNAIVVTFA